MSFESSRALAVASVAKCACNRCGLNSRITSANFETSYVVSSVSPARRMISCCNTSRGGSKDNIRNSTPRRRNSANSPATNVSESFGKMCST